ncbi:hypothetical protein LOAG_17675 [Loa loa]|uniref:SLC12A transporter C-terminal domain-containing protein n=1 Tax=Loa loa TaxID=7209 RepID=A0A1S0UJT4_LOALO|nr:hypothetical protein LOAG_17675 [Loa loa]EJD75117.1 hypothetical protein LOAG_17675 [Loa loa]
MKYASIIGCALLLLPLFTGSVCGINISSMLKSPTKNIPNGIFSSLLTMLFLITILACSLAFGIERHLLLDKYGRGTYPSFPIIFTISYPLVLITGLMLMSIASAIQSMYTAKSLLLSIITSHTIPVPRFFYQRASKRRKFIAIAITALLIIPYLLVNSMDYISIIANRSALCLSLIRDTGDQENIGSEDVRTARQYMEYIDLSGYATQFKYQKISSLHSIASALASCCGLGVFQSNTVIIEYPSEAALSGLPDSLLYHYHMHRVCVQHCNLVVVKGTFPLKIPPVKSNKTIDIWWIIDNGDVLLMVAKMLKKHKIWYKAKLRLFVVVDMEDDIKQIENALLLWLIDNHYLIYKIEFIQADVNFSLSKIELFHSSIHF